MRDLIRTDIASYDFIAFENCNNNCTFCFQKNTVNSHFVNPLEVLARFDTLLSHIRENHTQVSEINIDITGGELFYLPGLSEMYHEMFDHIALLKAEIGKPIRCLLGTNLLYKDTSVLYDVLGYIIRKDRDILRGVFTSFDVSGRFQTVERLELFAANADALSDYLYTERIPMAMVSVLSRDSIKRFMNPVTDMDIAFKKIYDRFYSKAKDIVEPEKGVWWLRLSWTALSPNSVSEEYTNGMVPTADEISGFYKYLVDNYPVLAVIHSFTERKKSLRCGANCHVCKTDTVEKSCNSNIYGPALLKADNLHVSSNDPIDIFKYLIRRFGCMSCKYFNVCYIRQCPVVLNLKTVEVGDRCWRKDIYEYVESKR